MRHVVQLVLAVLALAGAVIIGLQSRSVVPVAPVADGQPSTTSVAFDPPLMLLTWALVTAAGVLAVLGVAGLVRRGLLGKNGQSGVTGATGSRGATGATGTNGKAGKAGTAH